MKFLLCLTLIVVLASARGARGGYESMFKPARGCDAEKADDKIEEKLALLREAIPEICAEVTAEDAAVEILSVSDESSLSDGSEETAEKETKKEGKHEKRGGKRAPREVVDFLTVEKCAEAEGDLEEVVQELVASLDPCQENMTVKNLTDGFQKMCEKKDSEDNCEDVAADAESAWANFFNADLVNKHEFDLGVRKMKVMKDMERACSDDEEKEFTPVEESLRRLLRGKSGGRGNKGTKGEKPEKEENSEKPERELSAAMTLVAEFKEVCDVTPESVNELFDAVQKATAEEKEAREAEKEQDAVAEEPQKRPKRGRRSGRKHKRGGRRF